MRFPSLHKRRSADSGPARWSPASKAVVGLVALLILLAGGFCWADELNLAPRCLADYCPRCPQPWDAVMADGKCSQCLNRHWQAIVACGKKAAPAPLDSAMVGLWRSPSGLSMLLQENSQGLWGYLYWVPPSLTERYPKLWAVMAKMNKSADGGYRGKFLAPSGRWVPVKALLEGKKNLRTIFADNEVVKWTKTVILKRNPTGPDPAGR